MNASKYRVLLLAGWYYPDSVGGTERYVQLLGKELQNLNYDVTIAAPSNDEREHAYTYDGISIYRYPVSMVPDTAEVRGEVPPKHFDIFVNCLKKMRPDIIHMHSHTRGCGFFHAQYVKRLGIPLVLTVHVPGLTCVRGAMMRWSKVPCDGEMRIHRCSACWVQAYGIPRFVAWGAALQARKLITRRIGTIRKLFELTDQVVAVSKWLYDALLINGVPASKLSLCRHGLPEGSLIKNDVASKPFNNLLRIGYIGRFSPLKGTHILIEAIKRLPLDVPVELKLYGRTNNVEEEAYLRKLQCLAGKDNRILFCGEATDKNRLEILNNLEILAVPSLWLETGPLVVLEAFAAGIPVIGSNLGGIAELVKDGVNGMLVKCGNVKAWTAALKQISSHPALVKDLTRGIPPVRSIKEVVRETVSLYEKFLKNNMT